VAYHIRFLKVRSGRLGPHSSTRALGSPARRDERFRVRERRLLRLSRRLRSSIAGPTKLPPRYEGRLSASHLRLAHDLRPPLRCRHPARLVSLGETSRRTARLYPSVTEAANTTGTCRHPELLRSARRLESRVGSLRPCPTLERSSPIDWRHQRGQVDPSPPTGDSFALLGYLQLQTGKAVSSRARGLEPAGSPPSRLLGGESGGSRCEPECPLGGCVPSSRSRRSVTRACLLFNGARIPYTATKESSRPHGPEVGHVRSPDRSSESGDVIMLLLLGPDRLRVSELRPPALRRRRVGRGPQSETLAGSKGVPSAPARDRRCWRRGFRSEKATERAALSGRARDAQSGRRAADGRQARRPAGERCPLCGKRVTPQCSAIPPPWRCSPGSRPVGHRALARPFSGVRSVAQCRAESFGGIVVTSLDTCAHAQL